MAEKKKFTHNLKPQLAAYMDSLAKGNLTSDTEVLQAGLQLLQILGSIGVERSFVIPASSPDDRDKQIFIPGAIDLQNLAEPPTDTLPKETLSAKIEPN